MQPVPSLRGSCCAATATLQPVSVMAQASIRGMPKRSSKAACNSPLRPAPKPKRTPWCRSDGEGGRFMSMAGMTPR